LPEQARYSYQELNNILSPEDLLMVKEAVGIVEKAQENGIVLRIMGAIAVVLHSIDKPECRDLIKRLERLGQGGKYFTDIDLIGYKRQSGNIVDFFRKLGYNVDQMVLVYFGDKRLVFHHPSNKFHIDVFLSKLEFSHDIDFGEAPGKGLLETDYPTLSPADLVLEKLQIHQINEKDLKDLVTLFYCHEVSLTPDPNVIYAKRIADVLSDDWGFWFDAMENLNKTKMLANNLLTQGKITNDSATLVVSRIDELIKIIDDTPKTKNWLKRAKVGTKKKWYRDVEELFGR